MRTNPCPAQAGKVSLCAGFSFRQSLAAFALLFLLPGAILAQTPPLITYYDPGSFGDGDVIDLVIEYGDVENQLENVTSLYFEVAYEGFEVAEESELEVDAENNSWFGADGNYTSSVIVDHTSQIFRIQLTRTGESVSGYGHVMVLRGVEVVIDEIHMKRAPYIVQSAASHQVDHQAALSTVELYFDRSTGILKLDGIDRDNWTKLEVMEVSGRLVQVFSRQESQLYVGHLPRQIYVMRLHTSEGIHARKVAVFP